jgi:hypothetical protein
MIPSPTARAQQDWRNGLSIDENPFHKGSPEFDEYAFEHHRLTHEEFVRECLPTKQPDTKQQNAA